jgi:ERCC4-type nuclease
VQVDVTVDDREPRSLARVVGRHPDVASVEVRRLSAGDLAIDGIGEGRARRIQEALRGER